MDDEQLAAWFERLKFESWMAAPVWERWLRFDPPEDSLPWLN